MQLDDVAADMAAGAVSALRKGLSYQEATRVFQLALVNEALRQSGGKVRTAAARLSMSYAWVFHLMSGSATKRTSFRRGSNKLRKEKAEGKSSSVKQVLLPRADREKRS